MMALLANKWLRQGAMIVALLAAGFVALQWNNARVRAALLAEIRADINESLARQIERDAENETFINGLDDDGLRDLASKWVRKADSGD